VSHFIAQVLDFAFRLKIRLGGIREKGKNIETASSFFFSSV